MSHQATHAIELLITWKNKRTLPRLTALLVLFLELVDELADKVKDAIASPDLLPKITRGIALLCQRHRRVPGPAELALVEGEETGLRTVQVSRNVDQVRVYSEVREAASIGEERLPWVAAYLVLLDGVLYCLARERVLEFGRAI